MTTDKYILIIEDQKEDFDQVYNHLSGRGRQCLPLIGDYPEFISHIKKWAGATCDEDRCSVANYFNNYFSHIKLQLIILDINLLPDSKDQSGKEFAKFLRSSALFPYTPILLLTIFPFDSIKDSFNCSEGTPNYYLDKKDPDGGITKQFMEDRLDPIVSMLSYWDAIFANRAEIYNFYSKNNEFIELMNMKFGMLEIKIDEILNDTKYLKTYSELLLRMVQAELRKSDKKAAGIADSIIDQLGIETRVPELTRNTPALLKAIGNAKDELKKALMKEGINEFMSILKSIIRESAGIDDEEELSRAVATLVFRGIGRVYKLYKTGS